MSEIIQEKAMNQWKWSIKIKSYKNWYRKQGRAITISEVIDIWYLYLDKKNKYCIYGALILFSPTGDGFSDQIDFTIIVHLCISRNNFLASICIPECLIKPTINARFDYKQDLCEFITCTHKFKRLFFIEMS